MTIDKAIEILRDLLTELPQFSPDDRREAVQLGLDSLVRYKEQHEYPYHVISKSLPGETPVKW